MTRRLLFMYFSGIDPEVKYHLPLSLQWLNNSWQLLLGWMQCTYNMRHNHLITLLHFSVMNQSTLPSYITFIHSTYVYVKSYISLSKQFHIYKYTYQSLFISIHTFSYISNILSINIYNNMFYSPRVAIIHSQFKFTITIQITLVVLYEPIQYHAN